MLAAELTTRLSTPEAMPHGWFHHGAEILRLLDVHRPKVCVEIGTWLGASAIGVARSIRRWNGTITCVDSWAGQVNQALGSTPDDTPWMLVTCARNLRDAGVSASVRLIPATSSQAAEAWTGPAIDWLYIDADHSYPSVISDLTRWYPHVRPGGLLLGDDYDNPMFPGVRQAWDEFEQSHHVALTRFQSDPPHREGIQLVYGSKEA